MKLALVIFKIILLSSLSSCFYMPRIASYAILQDTRGLPSDQVSTITTISDSLSLSDFENTSKEDIKKANLTYKVRKRTRSVTLMPGKQTFRVTYDDIRYHKNKFITINTKAGATYTVNYTKDAGIILFWVVNDSTNIPIIDKISM